MINLEDSMPKNTEILLEDFSLLEDIGEWTLVGGTALAIHLKHRTSEDLDFFINKNMINSALKRKIDNMMSVLSEKYNVVEMQSDDEEYQLDYNLSGVKVTFCVTSSMNLKQDVDSHNYMDIASIDAIAAMKLYTLLRHRIKSRDFYDIKSLTERIGFDGIVQRMQYYFPKYNVAESKITNRFLKQKLASDDEGFQNLKLNSDETFESLRGYFNDLFIDKSKEDTFCLEGIKKDQNNLCDMKCRLFGLSNDSLGLTLLKRGMTDEFRKLISMENSNINPSCVNLEGESIISFLYNSSELDLFDKTLFLIDELPSSEIDKISNLGIDEKFRSIIDKHIIINRCLDKDSENIKTILNSKKVDIEEYEKYLDEKKECLLLNSSYEDDLKKVDEMNRNREIELDEKLKI